MKVFHRHFRVGICNGAISEVGPDVVVDLEVRLGRLADDLRRVQTLRLPFLEAAHHPGENPFFFGHGRISPGLDLRRFFQRMHLECPNVQTGGGIAGEFPKGY